MTTALDDMVMFRIWLTWDLGEWEEQPLTKDLNLVRWNSMSGRWKDAAGRLLTGVKWERVYYPPEPKADYPLIVEVLR